MEQPAGSRPYVGPCKSSDFRSEKCAPLPENHDYSLLIRLTEKFTQVHAYEHNHPGRPWVGTLAGPAEVTGDQMVAAMDAVGVDGAVLVSPFSMYRYDASYATEVYAAHPNRFRLIKPVDPTDPAVADTIADWAGTEGTVGIRVFLRDNVSTDPADPGINRVLAVAAQHSLPVNLERGDPGLLPGSVRDLLLRDPLQLEWPHRGGRRHGASAMVPVHALHGHRRKSGDVARQHRSRDLCAGGWRLDVSPQAVGAADECAVRDWLGQDLSHVRRRNGG